VVLVTVVITLPGQQSATIGRLLLVLLVLLADRRERAAGKEREQREHAVLLLARGSGTRLPRLSELNDDEIGVTPTRYSIEGAAPYIARPEADETIRNLLAAPGPRIPS
jgi:hypothetical protein